MAKGSRKTKSSGTPGTASYRDANSGGSPRGLMVHGQLTPAQWVALRRAVRAAAIANHLRKGKKRGKKAEGPTALQQARAQGYKH